MSKYMISQGVLKRESLFTYCAFKIPYLLSVCRCEILNIQKLKLTHIHLI